MMRKLIFIFICLFTFTKTISQNDTNYDNQEQFLKNFNFKIGAGIFIPQGKLNDYFGTSPLIELNFKLLSLKEKSLGIAFQFAIPGQNKNFNFIRNIDTVNTKSNLMLNVFFKLNKDILKTKKNHLKAFFGLGISTIQLNARNPFYSGQEGEEKYEFISTILFAPGIDFTHCFKNDFKITFGVNYHYSPFKTEGALREDIGHSGLIPKILFTF
jgi:hypothetical protein